jgi:hypothetical protein
VFLFTIGQRNPAQLLVPVHGACSQDNVGTPGLALLVGLFGLMTMLQKCNAAAGGNPLIIIITFGYTQNHSVLPDRLHIRRRTALRSTHR